MRKVTLFIQAFWDSQPIAVRSPIIHHLFIGWTCRHPAIKCFFEQENKLCPHANYLPHANLISEAFFYHPQIEGKRN
jgi:hypothetical protein